MQIVTVNDAEDLEKLSDCLYVKGAVMSSSSSPLSKSSVSMKSVVADLKGKAPEGVTDRNLNLAYYNSPSVTTNREIYLVGVGTAGLLEIKPEDVVCVATSLNSALGMGAVICAMVRNATAYLPDPAKFEFKDSSLVFGDMAQISTLRNAAQGSKLRGGVLCTGQGDDVLNATEDLGGIKLKILGSGSEDEVMRPLTDA